MTVAGEPAVAVVPPAPRRAGPREWIGLIVLTLPPLLIAVDFTVLHLAVPHLSAALGPTSTQQLWIVDSYGFAVAGLLITMGTLGDRIGRRKLLLTGSAAFAAASVLAAYSTSPEQLIGARVLLGITGATLLPATISLITNMFRDPGQRRFAIAVWTTSFVVGGAVGPLVGGVMLQFFWWGSVFLLAVPVMVILLATGPWLVPEFRDPQTGGVDLRSVALSLAAILAVVYGVKEIAAYGFGAVPLLSVVVGAAVGVWFVRRQRRLTNPLLDLALFARRTFSVSLGAQLLSLFTLGAMQFLLMQYLQLVLEMSPLAAGLWTVPAVVAGIVANLLSPALARRFSQVSVILAGLVIGVIGLVVIGLAGDGTVLSGLGGSPEQVNLALVVVGFGVMGLGLNPVMVLTYDLILSDAPPERAGTASGTAETGNELGLALGVAVAGSISAAVYRSRVTAESLPPELTAEQVTRARDTLGTAARVAEELPDPLAGAVLQVVNGGFSAGMRVAAFTLAAVLVGVAITVRTLLARR